MKGFYSFNGISVYVRSWVKGFYSFNGISVFVRSWVRKGFTVSRVVQCMLGIGCERVLQFQLYFSVC